MASTIVPASLGGSQVLTISEAADALALAPETLRRYDRAGRLDSAVFRTLGNHRRFDLPKLRLLLGIQSGETAQEEQPTNSNRVIALVSRASSAKQADTSIPEQKRDLEAYATANYPGKPFRHFTRTASGLNFDAIMPLVDEVINGGIERVIACNYDRLLRLGNKLLIQVFAVYGTEVTFINDSESTDSLELDLLGIVQWYCNSYSGKRFAAKYGCKPSEEQLTFINNSFTQGIGLKKTLALLEKADLINDATGKPITPSFLQRYRRKHRRLFRRIGVIHTDDASSALPKPADMDSFSAFIQLLDKEVGKMKFKEAWQRYQTFTQGRGQLAQAQNTFSTRLRAAGFRTTYYNGYLYLRAGWKA